MKITRKTRETYIILQFLAWLFRWKLVWLIDHHNELRLSRVKEDCAGSYAHVYWYTRTGHVHLNSDGTCQSKTSSYIERWLPHRSGYVCKYCDSFNRIC